MGVFDDIMPDVAATMIGVFGTSAVLRRTVPDYRPESGDRVNSVTDYAVTVSPPRQFNVQQVNGTTILQGDVTTTVAAQGLAVTPDPKTDVLILGGVTYKVITVSPKMAGAVPAAFELQCRK